MIALLLSKSKLIALLLSKSKLIAQASARPQDFPEQTQALRVSWELWVISTCTYTLEHVQLYLFSFHLYFVQIFFCVSSVFCVFNRIFVSHFYFCIFKCLCTFNCSFVFVSALLCFQLYFISVFLYNQVWSWHNQILMHFC